MNYKIYEDEEYFLDQVKLSLESNQSIPDVPQVWRPAHFDANRFQGAYYKLCIAICPNLKIPHIDYFLTLNFTESQTASITAWIDWLRIRMKRKAVASDSGKSDREAQNRYNDALKKKLEVFKLERHRKEQEKVVVPTPTEDKWGRTTKPKIEDDGNSWREQE